jgi:hypothetical protein
MTNACTEFFRVNGGIFSPADEQNANELQYFRANEAFNNEPLTWGSANKKLQECLASYYLMSMKKIMNLSEAEVDNLRQTILLGVANKYFGDHNISVVDNQIISISGLLWNPEKRIFYIDPSIEPLVSRSYSRVKDSGTAIEPAQKDMIPQFGVKWGKYVDMIEKKILLRTRRNRTITVTQADTTPARTGFSTANSISQASLTDIVSNRSGEVGVEDGGDDTIDDE